MLKKLSLLTLFCYGSLFALAQNHKLIVGTYTKGTSEGIYVYDFDSKTAETKQLSIIKNIANPSYVALSKNNDAIYSVSEVGANSAAAAFKFNPKTNEGTIINKEATKGADPCFILTDGKHVFTANYSGGSISVYGIKVDGSLTPVKQLVQHTGSGPDKRQTSAHVHQTLFSPDGKYVISTDLGEDKIYVYSYQANAEKPLTLKHSISTNPGSGPRHITFSPNGKFAYLAHEFNGKISVFGYNDGNLKLLQEIGTAASDFTGRIDAADIHISADGKFLYESNRGDANNISVFAVQKDGKLKHIETVSTLGKGPRNFSIDPSGNYLLVGHQYSNDIIIFQRDAETGKLADSKKRISVGSPVCLIFGK
ncbi:lactonase family protein [Pedobacter chitinilyticus]|uniref:Lactonase family protein n=1 Tax=Pedobacter chitinilyticus TaxID=2233776 RepID=A0A3S3QF78_9SPHI|nr:lactonase family protein [Pedobacter chitinilyticus]RWU06443.1 lactonase family protein [Pedobacter chitinilyticus]